MGPEDQIQATEDRLGLRLPASYRAHLLASAGPARQSPAEQLGDTIVISTTADMRVLLINSGRLDAGGEWEAWDFPTWHAGAYRYPSFGRLVAALAQEQ